MGRTNNTSLERVRYWQGQLLSSGDLQTQLRVDQELRRLHNAAAHRAYGIAIGLSAVANDVNDLKKGLSVGCGLAYDCAGRALIIKEDLQIDVPANPTDGDTLVLSYDPQRREGVKLEWTNRAKVNPANGIALARLSKESDEQSEAKIDEKFRAVIARPLARPPLATGITVPGSTAWQTWRLGNDEVGVQVLVDTTASGFTTIPHYFAEAITDKVPKDFVPAWLASIADPSSNSFTLQLLMRRITRESLKIVDSKVQITSAPELSKPITVDAGNLLKTNDLIARLLPLAEHASKIKSLETDKATLEAPLENLLGTKQVAFGNVPRVAKVTKNPGLTSTFEIKVDTPGNFVATNVIVNLSVSPDRTQPAVVLAVKAGANNGTLTLVSPIPVLQPNHQLGVARNETLVTTVSSDGKEIEVSDATLFAQGKVIVRLGDNVSVTSPTRIESKTGNSLKLTTPLLNVQAGTTKVGVVELAGTVLEVTTDLKEQKVEVDNTELFRKHDLVAKLGNPVSEPVRIDEIEDGQLLLSAPIAGLKKDDVLIAADFRVRATVTEVEGVMVFVADPTQFPQQSYVAAIDDLLSATLPARLMPPIAGLTLNHPIDGLEAGEVIGLCRFPPTVTVKAQATDGAVTVDGPGIQAGDLVMLNPPQSERPELFVVTEVQGNVVKLAGKVPKAGDSLAVANTRGVIEVTSTNSPKVVTISGSGLKRVRTGDYLAEITDTTGWIQPFNNSQAVAAVIGVNSNSVSLSAYIDGLLLNDTVGLASLIPNRMRIRLEEAIVLSPDDRVLILGTDRRRGTSQSLFAVVVLPPSERQVLLSPEAPGEPFEFRPQDIFASVLFVSGSPLRLIKDLDLYVSWFACGESDRMPRPCDGASAPSDPCANAKEPII